MWGLGDYPAVVDKVAAVGELIVERAGEEGARRGVRQRQRHSRPARAGARA